MKRPDPTMFALQQLTSNLSKVDRNHHILDSERAENDTEHSFTVALLCWYIHNKLNLNLDLSKILTYAMVHDFAEVYAGDVNTFASQRAREQKVAAEAAAIQRLNQEFQDFPDMIKALHDYEGRNDDEALFVWTIDKMQPLILSDLDNWRPHKKVNVSYEDFLKKHGEQITAGSPYCREIFAALHEYCRSTYYDRPMNSIETMIK